MKPTAKSERPCLSCGKCFVASAKFFINLHSPPHDFQKICLSGAGMRAIDKNFLLFEKVLNAVHEHAPQARICFNTSPFDTAEAVQRWCPVA